ncbi:MAG: hypothetical protein MUF25_05975 [Pirellulaceae bacterium]|nr:hypothetical protein [Pirellulaceae bacterium]
MTIACLVVTLWCDSADATTESNHRACDAVELTPGIRFEPRNASLVVTLDNGRTVTLVPSIKRSATVDEAFTGPGDPRQKPTFDQYPDCQVLTATYALPKDRTFRVQIRKYPGTTGVTVASELISDSNRAVTEYFYGSWSNPGIELTVGGEDLKPQTLRLDPNKYNPIGSVNWAYGDWGTDGLLVVPRGFNLGTTDNNAANCYLTAIPPERLLGRGDALSVVFGLARAPEPDAAPKIAAGLLERLGGARQKPAAQKTIAYPYADSLMWEAMVYDYSGNKMQDNDTLLALGEECAQAAAHGKPV